MALFVLKLSSVFAFFVAVSGSSSSISSSELYNIGKQIWAADTARLNYGVDFTLNLQGGASYGRFRIFSHLFRSVKQTALEGPTFKALRSLFDNYNPEVGRVEKLTQQKTGENWIFLNKVLATDPMKLVYRFLYSKKKVRSFSDFRRRLYSLWFDVYSRKRYPRVKDTSGFEHVFVGETDSYKISGFHNWVQFYLEEKKNALTYKGYKGSMKHRYLKSFQFSWRNRFKSYGSFFIGTSPEFELAIYSLTVLSGIRGPTYNLGNYKVQIKCYTMDYGTKVATCYPKLL